MNCYKLETEGHIEYWRKGKLHRDNKELGRKRIMDIKIILILSSILVSLVLIIIWSYIKDNFDIGFNLIPLTLGIAMSLLIIIKKDDIKKIIESQNTVQSDNTNNKTVDNTQKQDASDFTFSTNTNFLIRR